MSAAGGRSKSSQPSCDATAATLTVLTHPAAHLGTSALGQRTWDHLSEHGWERLRAGLAAGDPDGEVASVWLACELLVEVYAAEDLAHARRRLIVFFQHAADAEISELMRLARTTDAWSEEILAFHTTGGASNGPTEALNLIIEKIRRTRRCGWSAICILHLEAGRPPTTYFVLALRGLSLGS